MKTNTPPPSSGPPLQTVLFEFFDLLATSVTIAGTFNDWQPHATALLKLGAGRWARKLVLPPGIYEYRFVVDGKWMSDPTAAETALNPFGQVNSVVKVTVQFEDISEPQVPRRSVRARRKARRVRRSRTRSKSNPSR